MQLYGITSGKREACYNMALDEALLEWVRMYPDPLLVVRTYQWQKPSLSLGVNQPERDIAPLLRLHQDAQPALDEDMDIVQRPTGGRAILHGTDISFSFVTNQPTILKDPLKVTYWMFSEWLCTALEGLSIPVTFSGSCDDRQYTRSAACFETQTASDLICGTTGNKIAGSAQLRRAGGLLQHGAVFVQSYGVAYPRFTQALFHAVSDAQQRMLQPLPPQAAIDIELACSELQAVYRKTSGEILAKASTTSGSHLVPASC